MKKMKALISTCMLFAAILFCGIIAEAAQELEINTPVQVSTAEGSYRFTIGRQGKVILNATSADGERYGYGLFTLYETDEDENEIEVVSAGIYDCYYSWNSGINTTPVRLPAGTYIIKYTCNSSGEGKANLKIQYTEETSEGFELEKNNDWSTANAIALNKEYTANLQSKSDVDTYWFNLTQAGNILLSLRNIGTVKNCWKVDLYAEDTEGNRNLINSWMNTENKKSKFTRYRLPIGKYYIKVSAGNAFKADDYYIGTVYEAETSADSEIEYNNSIDTANTIKTNSEYKANIPTTKDIDYYIFNLQKASKLTLKVRQENDSITKGLYNLTLYRENEDGTQIIYDRFNTTADKVSQGNEVKAPAGIYVICVKNNNGKPEDVNDYILKVEQADTEEVLTVPDTPQDVEGESGIPLAVNSTALVSTAEGRYLFAIPREGYVALSVAPVDGESSGYGLFTLYETDEDENEIEVVSAGIYDAYYSWNSGIINKTPVRLPAGTYIIKYTCDNSGEKKANLKIQYDQIPDLSEAVINPIEDKTYTGTALIPEIEVTYNGKQLKEKKDYTVAYENNISAGTAIVTINPVAAVSVGTQSTTFIIKKRLIPVPIVKQSEFVYDKAEKQVLLDSEDMQYLIAENNKQVNTGIYMAKYSIDTNNCEWEGEHEDVISIPWSIKKANATLSVSTITYTKSVTDAAFPLAGISTNSDGKITYAVNTGADVVSVNDEGQVTPLKAGTAIVSVKVAETGNYNGSPERTINILIEENKTANSGNAVKPDEIGGDNSQTVSKTVKTKVKITKAVNKKGKKVSLKLSGKSIGDGYQIQYGTKNNFKNAKNIKKSGSTVILSKLKKGRKYYIRARVYKKIGNQVYYGKWSNKKSVKVKK